ncbi:glycosyltransferase [Gordonia phthalatica]|uniref:glycosyltransferase n=1 Tax=Gordonia phthalatica TaxID=1136941 RepID=UPI0007818F61|nr:glycosyltransferase [Gordonia phthalatica]
MTLRVIHVAEAYGGGVQTAIAAYIAATPQYEHELIVRARDGQDTARIPDGVAVTRLDGALVGFLAGAARMLWDADFDIVHLHSSFAGVLRALIPSRGAIVYTPHCYATESVSGWRRRIYWAAERALSARPQTVLAVSDRESRLARALTDRAVVVTVPNAVPAGLRQAPMHAGHKGGRRVVAIGRICAQKGPTFFAAVAQLVGDRAEFIWIGDGDEGREALLAAGVEITGWRRPEVVRAWLEDADLCLHTAAWEGSPLATLEAAAAGLPVVARGIESMRSLGYVDAGSDPSQVAATVVAFFADESERLRVCEATRALRSRYSDTAMATALGAAYETAVTSGGRRHR